MKTFARLITTILIIAASSCILFSTSCTKDDDNDDGDIFMDENWLIGTWEATTPAIGDLMFDNKKIRIVFDEVALKHTDTVPHNSVKTWMYSGALAWDVDNAGVGSWSMKFYHNTYPTGLTGIGWQSMSMIEANVTINNISLRIGDTVNMDPNPEIDFDLDWGPYNDYTRKPPTVLDFYGDIEIYLDGIYHVAYYRQNEGNMIRFTKK